MTLFLANKHVLLGVTGSIAAYKSADLVRRLREVGAVVRVAMTRNAERFITALTMQAVSGNPVHTDLFDVHAEAAMGHIELARWADVILVAPASADFMARLVHGHANDLLTTLCLASKAPIALAPAMNQGMWKHTLTTGNVQALIEQRIHLFGPAEGDQACGDIGPGRMLEPGELIGKLNELFSTGALAGTRVLITAGATQEAIDPVRYISNHSSGKMGYALAQAAREAGASVTLISGPVHLDAPHGVSRLSVTSAQEMHDAVMKKISECDIFLSVAAVGDYRAKHINDQKIHKKDEHFQLELVQNPDIVASVGALAKKPFIVGFAAETEELVKQAHAKRERKKMDMIVANQVGQGIGMGSDDNEVTVITADREIHFARMPKGHLARELIALMAAEFKKRPT